MPRGRHPREGADYNSHPASGQQASPAPLPSLRGQALRRGCPCPRGRGELQCPGHPPPRTGAGEGPGGAGAGAARGPGSRPGCDGTPPALTPLLAPPRPGVTLRGPPPHFLAGSWPRPRAPPPSHLHLQSRLPLAGAHLPVRRGAGRRVGSGVQVRARGRQRRTVTAGRAGGWGEDSRTDPRTDRRTDRRAGMRAARL